MFPRDGQGLIPRFLRYQQLFNKCMVMIVEFTDLISSLLPFKTGGGLTNFNQGVGSAAQGTQDDNLFLRISRYEFCHFMHTLRFTDRSASEFHDFHANHFWDRKYTNENATKVFK